MNRIINITLKDLLQFGRDPKIFFFLLIMPVVFTLMFGFAFGGFSSEEKDNRLPVGYLDQDGGTTAGELRTLLSASSVIRLVEDSEATEASLLEEVAQEDLAGAILVPPGYSDLESPAKLRLIADPATTGGLSVQAEVQAVANRMASSIQIAQIVGEVTSQPAEASLAGVLAAWQKPPIVVKETASALVEEKPANTAMANSSPSNMIQFAIAGLLTAAMVMVAERKTRCHQRLLTTATTRLQILSGHFLAILALILGQFIILIAFGQLLLKVNYLLEPLATLLVALATAICIAALGILIGVLAKSDEQAIMFSLLAMFLFSPIGGAWVPLETTSPTFQAIGHFSPVAWALDGFKNVVVRGLGLESVLLPAAALLGYAVVFFGLGLWRLSVMEEK